MLDLVNFATAAGYVMAIAACFAALLKLRNEKHTLAYSFILLLIIGSSASGLIFEIASWPSAGQYVALDVKQYVRTERTFSALIFFVLVVRWIDTVRRRSGRGDESGGPDS